jgi:hypothetical protein
MLQKYNPNLGLDKYLNQSSLEEGSAVSGVQYVGLCKVKSKEEYIPPEECLNNSHGNGSNICTK